MYNQCITDLSILDLSLDEKIAIYHGMSKDNYFLSYLYLPLLHPVSIYAVNKHDMSLI